MVKGNGSAEIVNMEDARAKRRALDADPDAFRHAGAYLQSVREAAGLTLDEIAIRTHIKAAYLDAIERLDEKAMPSRPFTLGFVKAYAETLGLDAGDIVSRFKSDAGIVPTVEVETKKFEAAEAAAAEADRPEMSLWAVFAVVAFILWCALLITRPREETTPFGYEGGRAAIEAGAPEIPEGLELGAPPEPLPRVLEPRLVERIEPVYPQRCEAEAAQVETVEVAFNLTRGGVLQGERIAASSNPCFDNAALNAVRRWRFSPRTVDGQAAPAYDLRYTLTFEKPL